MKNLFLSLLLIVILCSCNNNDDALIPVNEDQLILFQFEYRNSAWGYQHSGWFIDNKGNVKEYNLPTEWRWNNDSNFISKDSLAFNYAQANTLIGNINLQELEDKKLLITATINGILSSKMCPGADMGSFSFYSYYWDASKKMYQKQLLNLTGDCEQYNTTIEAIELTAWLTKF